METNIPSIDPSAFPAGTPKNNTLAITSLGLGIAGIPLLCLSILFGLLCACPGGLLGIGAIVTGFIARSQIKTTGEGGNGMALAGIIMGGAQIILVVFFTLIMLILLVFGPAVGQVFSTINSSLK